MSIKKKCTKFIYFTRTCATDNNYLKFTINDNRYKNRKKTTSGIKKKNVELQKTNFHYKIHCSANAHENSQILKQS